MLEDFITGKNVTDRVCLDKSQKVCLDDFNFVMASEINYDKVQDIAMAGVIPFNQYMNSVNPRQRLVRDLYMSGIFFEKTL